MNKRSYPVKQCFAGWDLVIFTEKTRVFEHVEQHINPMLGSSFIANFRLTMNGPRGVITCSRGSTEVTTGSYKFQDPLFSHNTLESSGFFAPPFSVRSEQICRILDAVCHVWL